MKPTSSKAYDIKSVSGSIGSLTNTQIAILAAGKGTRLKNDVTKAIVKLNNKPLISFLIDSINSINPVGKF